MLIGCFGSKPSERKFIVSHLEDPIKITNIRAGRKKPGLAAQHLTGVNAVAEITEAEVTGAEIGSQELTFRPHTLKAGTYTFDVARIQPSAGSISLVFQAIVLPLVCANAPSTVTLRGGTHVAWSPAVHCFGRRPHRRRR